MNDNAIVLKTGGDFLVPAAPLQTMIATYQAKKDFIGAVLAEGVDYGKIPGAGDKPALFKAGAEKMTSFFGLAPLFEDIQAVEDWTGADHNGEAFFYYRQRCKLFRGDRLIGSAEGSCNSWEKKYRYRWLSESDVPAGLDKSKLKTRGGRISEFTFALDKSETTGQYGKPAEYWKRFKDAIEAGTAAQTKRTTKSGKAMDAWEIDSTLYCVPNDDVADQVNTILKMAQKRALVAAVLIATNISDYFTQDIEDYTDRPIVEGVVTEVKPAAPVASPAPVEPEQPGQFVPAPAAPAKPVPANVRTAKLGGKDGHNYPAAWVKDLMVKVIGPGKCNEFEVDGILQKINIDPIVSADTVIGSVEAYLNAKEHGFEPLEAARTYLLEQNS